MSNYYFWIFVIFVNSIEVMKLKRVGSMIIECYDEFNGATVTMTHI